MSFYAIFKNLLPYVKPFQFIILCTLLLTVVSAGLAQVNALVLEYAVNAVNELIGLSPQNRFEDGVKILSTISAILIGKEILVAITTFAQKYLGAKLRISISKRLALKAVERVLSYRMAFFSARDNEAGKLQTRIDRGVESLTRLVNNFFIDILPLVASAICALVLMFSSSWKVGLVAVVVIPIFFAITIWQGNKLRGWREKHRHYREARSHAILNLIQSIAVIKSFNREAIESEKQYELQEQITENQLKTHKTGFLFEIGRAHV